MAPATDGNKKNADLSAHLSGETPYPHPAFSIMTRTARKPLDTPFGDNTQPASRILHHGTHCPQTSRYPFGSNNYPHPHSSRSHPLTISSSRHLTPHHLFLSPPPSSSRPPRGHRRGCSVSFAAPPPIAAAARSGIHAGPSAQQKERRTGYSHFLNLKNQKVKHEMKIIRPMAKIYPTGMTCPFTSHTHSNSGMALKFMP